MKNLAAFSKFISAREAVRVNREAGKPWPWTRDPILQKFRFCNINREHDTVTRGIRGLYDGMSDKYLWFHLVVARLFNHLPTLTLLGQMPMVAWDKRITRVTQEMIGRGERVFNPAYIVSTNGHKMAKVPYLIEHVLDPIAHDWTARKPPLHTCQAWADYLLTFNGLGDFMVNQIVTDMKYTTLLPYMLTDDWTSFVMAGPGTKRGLNRLQGRPTRDALSRTKAYDELLELRAALIKHQHPLVNYFLDLNNLANSLCEFDKMMRVSTGEGKPKQLYRHKDT